MKALKIFGMAILACSVLFVSCKKDDKKDDTTTTKSYTITVNANNATMGTVTGGGTYKANETATLTATANAGYEFVQWQDGNKENPRKVTVTADATYTATFKEEAGTTIAFNGNSWNAAQVLAADKSSNGYMAYQIMRTAGSTEDIYLVGYLQYTPGTYNYTTSDGDYMGYYDPTYIYEVGNQDDADLLSELTGETVAIGDEFWGWNANAQSFQETVVDVDLNAHTTSALFIEEIFDIANLVASGGQSYGTTKSLNGYMYDAPWTLASTKADNKKNNHKLLSKVK